MLNRIEVSRRLSIYYSERFNGQVTSDFDEHKRAYQIYGESLPSHPSCPWPFWTMIDYLVPQKARELVTSKSDEQLKRDARIKAAQVKAQADAIVEGPDHPWRKERERRERLAHTAA